MPILTREVTIHMEPGINANASLDLSNLGFLLGTFPSAPGTLFYAIQYNVAADMVRQFNCTNSRIRFNILIADCHGDGGVYFYFNSFNFRLGSDGLIVIG